MPEFTLIVPFYRNSKMLFEQMRHWYQYPDGVRIIVVDDGSPEDARSILRAAPESLLQRIELYRITIDIPWNRGGARNLGAKVAQTDWIVHVDIDHVMPVESAERLLAFNANPKHWYRFERYRKGRADETRKKDALPEFVEFGKIHPHIDSYLCTRAMFWKARGYDEDYSGCLGGGSPFLAQLARVGEVQMAPVCLHVYTRSVVADASDEHLSRDRAEYAKRKRKKELTGRVKAENPLRFPWVKQDLHASVS